MTQELKQIKSLPLLETYRERGAKIAEFAGWEVPIYFTSIIDEHHRVRHEAGLFDISHMGYFLITGPDSRSFLNKLLTASFERLVPGNAIYSLMTKECGGIIDDVILYQKGEDDYFLIVNSATLEKDWAWLNSNKEGFQIDLVNASSEKAFFALQGPESENILKELTGLELEKMGRFQFLVYDFQGMEVVICRTGYTGEDGFEILVPHLKGYDFWSLLMVAGEKHGLVPAGFGCRDSLRLEARYSLYGHELTEEVTPVEAGLSWAVDFEKDFIGSGIIREQKKNGYSRRLIGFEVVGRGIPREGYSLYLNGELAGQVTSGGMSPTLKKNIGLGYVESKEPVKDGLEIEIRGTKIPCQIVKGPFYIGESLKRFAKKS